MCTLACHYKETLKYVPEGEGEELPEGDELPDGEEPPDGEGELAPEGLGEDPEPLGDGEGEVDGEAKRLLRMPA